MNGTTFSISEPSLPGSCSRIMAFGDTGILDDFNRSDEGPPPSSDWTVFLLDGHEVVSNQLEQGSSQTQGSYWNVETFGPDCEVFITYADRRIGNPYPSVALRITDPGSTWEGYGIQWHRTGTTLTVSRYDDGSGTQLGADITAPSNPADGDKWGASMTGDTITVYTDTGSGWESEGTRVEDTYDAAGYIGFFSYDNGANRNSFDDFGGGTLAAVSGQPVMKRTQGIPTGPGSKDRPGRWN